MNVLKTRARGVRSLAQDQQGSALVEGAVLVPLLFVLLFGVYEFSWFIYQQHLVSTGVRDAARYLARVADACDPASPAWDVEQARARNLAVSGSINGGSERVRGWSAAMVLPHCAAIDNRIGPEGLSSYRGPAVIHVVTVSTRFAEPSLGFLGFLHLSPLVISISHSERAIGPG